MAKQEWEKQIASKRVLHNKLKQFFGVSLEGLHIATRNFRGTSWPDIQTGHRELLRRSLLRGATRS
jgi:hypothetical protein